VFIAVTIVVGELGGRGPALVTAVRSAVSVNFFLTEPDLTVEIEKLATVSSSFPWRPVD